MDKFVDKFLEMSLFDHIKASELILALNCIGGFMKSYDTKNYIILDGESIEYIGVVISGMVHMIKEDVWGSKSILVVIEPSQIFGEAYVFGNSNKSHVSFLSAENSEVLFLPFKRFIHTCPKSCAHHQQLINNMVSLMANENLQLTEKLEVITKRTIRAKILTYLSQESQKNNNKYFTIPLGRIEMADFLCIDRSALTRELNKMKDEGILDYSNNTFRLYECNI